MQQYANRTFIYNALAVLFLLLTAGILVTDPQWTSTGRGGVSFIVAALCAFLGNLDRIESFKASFQGVEGKTRELVERAETAAQIIRRVAVELGKVLVEMDAAGNRYGGSGPAEKDARRERLIKALGSINVSQAEIDKVASADRKYVLIDYLSLIGNTAQLFSQAEKANGIANPINAHIRRLLNEGKEPPPSSDFSEVIRENMNGKSGYIEALMSSYDNYLATGKHGSPEIWAKRDEWNVRDQALRDWDKHNPQPPTA